jgi:hypothetical protein
MEPLILHGLVARENALMNRQRWGIAIAWIGTLAAAVVIGMRVPNGVLLEALALELAIAVVGGFALQLATGEPEGILQRLTASAVGSFVIVLVAALVFGLR